MADDFQSQPRCSKCLDKGFIDTVINDGHWQSYKINGDVFICECNSVPLDVLERESIARLRTTNKLNGCSDHNQDLALLNAVKRHKL